MRSSSLARNKISLSCCSATDNITNSVGMNVSEFREMVREREAWRAAVQGITKSHKESDTSEQLNYNINNSAVLPSNQNITSLKKSVF